jgi:hypothetical protein
MVYWINITFLFCKSLLTFNIHVHTNAFYLAFEYFYQRTWWRLLHKHVARTKFDIYVFITYFGILSAHDAILNIRFSFDDETTSWRTTLHFDVFDYILSVHFIILHNAWHVWYEQLWDANDYHRCINFTIINIIGQMYVWFITCTYACLIYYMCSNINNFFTFMNHIMTLWRSRTCHVYL